MMRYLNGHEYRQEDAHDHEDMILNREEGGGGGGDGDGEKNKRSNPETKAL